MDGFADFSQHQVFFIDSRFGGCIRSIKGIFKGRNFALHGALHHLDQILLIWRLIARFEW